MTAPRIALFVLEALPNAVAVRRFVADHRADIAFVGLSNAERPNAGGFFGQTWRHLKRSGPGFLPYLIINFALPDLLRPFHRVLAALGRRPLPPTAMPLKALCRDLGIPSLRIDDVNGAAVARAFETYRPDLIVAFHFDQIFSGATLRLAPVGGLNVHPALLPHHRGPVPTIHALAAPTPSFGVTVHRLAERIDAGTILAQQAVALPPTITASAAAVLLHEHGRLLLDKILTSVGLHGMPEGTAAPLLPYCPFPSPAMLRDMRRRGRRLSDEGDLFEAMMLSGIARPGRRSDKEARAVD